MGRPRAAAERMAAVGWVGPVAGVVSTTLHDSVMPPRATVKMSTRVDEVQVQGRVVVRGAGGGHSGQDIGIPRGCFGELFN